MPASRRQSLRRAASNPVIFDATPVAIPPGRTRGRGRGRLQRTGSRQCSVDAPDTGAACSAGGVATTVIIVPPGEGEHNEAAGPVSETLLEGNAGGGVRPSTGVFDSSQPTSSSPAAHVSNQPMSDQNSESPQKDQQTANPSLQTPGTSAGSAETETPERPDCGICLEPCLHPVRLPCRHVFCYLCVKGAVRQSGRCCYCRAEVDEKYFNSPELLEAGQRDLREELEQASGHQWFYQGRNGWWQYDKRTNDDIETAFTDQENSVQIQVAGELYTVDLVGMTQYSDQCRGRRRRVKRERLSDGPTAQCKGVAGIRKKQRRN